MKDEYVAYCFDEAVLIFGDGIEDRLDQIPEQKTLQAQSAMRRRMLERLLSGASQFADPAKEK